MFELAGRSFFKIYFSSITAFTQPVTLMARARAHTHISRYMHLDTGM